MESLILLLVYACSSEVKDDCQVWQEMAWKSNSVSIAMCTTERDLARSIAIKEGRVHDYYACAIYSRQDLLAVNF